jgi:hypothetical protein
VRAEKKQTIHKCNKMVIPFIVWVSLVLDLSILFQPEFLSELCFVFLCYNGRKLVGAHKAGAIVLFLIETH